MRLWHFSSSVHSLILQTCMRCHPVGLDVCFLVGPFIFFHTSCVRTAKPAHPRSLAWAFASRLRGKYHNLMSWLNFTLANTSAIQFDQLWTNIFIHLISSLECLRNSTSWLVNGMSWITIVLLVLCTGELKSMYKLSNSGYIQAPHRIYNWAGAQQNIQSHMHSARILIILNICSLISDFMVHTKKLWILASP